MSESPQIPQARFAPIKVGIAIVSYKSAALAIDCLCSIESERDGFSPSLQVVVVDNASGDAPTIEKAIKGNGWTSWVTSVSASKNGGFAYGNNLAYAQMRKGDPPDYIYLLNPDTIVRKGAISALVQFFESHPSVGVVGSSFEHPDGTPWPFAFRFPSLLSELESGLQFALVTRLLHRYTVPVQMGLSSQPVDWVSGASMMIRRSLFDALGGLDENFFLYFEETDFCLRAKKTGFATWYVPESRVMHIAGQSSKVTERNVALKRLPPYWFESRRRYFVCNYGYSYAMAVDAVALLACGLGAVKLAVQKRPDRRVPFFIRDLLHHSVLRSPNRKLPTN